MKCHSFFIGFVLIGFGNFALQAQPICPSDTLRLSEIRFHPLPGDFQFIEIINIGENPVSLPGVTVASGDRNYTIPPTVTEMMGSEDVVVIYFDGGDPSTDDVLFSDDGRVVLHGPAEEFLGNPVGHCGLYRTAGIRSRQLLLDFVAWGGEPDEHAKDAVDKSLWPTDTVYLQTNPDNPPDGPGFFPIIAGRVIARDSVGNWHVIPSGQASPGSHNLFSLHAPLLEFPGEGLETMETPARFWWNDVAAAESYRVQVALDTDFSEPVADETVDEAAWFPSAPMPDDTRLYWRVNATNGEETSEWSETRSFIIGVEPMIDDLEPKSLDDSASIQEGHATFQVSGVIRDSLPSGGGVRPPLPNARITIGGIAAVTDAQGRFTVAGLAPGTHLVEMSRDHYNFPAGPFVVTITDSNVTGLSYQGTGHTHAITRGGGGLPALGARKDTTIVATKRGAASNRMPEFSNANQQGWDVPHNQANIANLHLESWWCWAVGIAMVNNFYGGTLTRDEIVIHVRGDLLHDRDAGSNWDQYVPGLQWAFQQDNLTNFDVRNRGGGDITEAEVKAWLNDNRPLYFRRPGHIMVIDQYLYWGGNLWARFVNTDNNGASKMWRLSTVNNGGVIAPRNAIAAQARATDPRIAQDPDGDGLNNYDEARFGTNPNNIDTDGDGVPDKAEIRSWAFPRTRPQGGNVAGHASVIKDVDGDGRDPQVDPDTDGGGIRDGDEDLNRDGVLDPGETDPYDRTDDRVLDLAFVIDTTGSMGPYINQVKANAIAIVNQVEENFKNFRIAVVEYRDHPPQDTRPYRAVRAFSQDKDVIIAGINSLSVGGGGDLPESLNYALINTANAVNLFDADGVGWRGQAGDTIRRAIIYMTDAPAHNPEPTTGLTNAMAAAVLNSGGIRSAAGGIGPLSSEDSGDGFAPLDDVFVPPPGPERSGPITVYPVVVTTNARARQDAEEFAGATGGIALFTVAAGVADAILTALEDITLAPNAVLVVTDAEGNPNVRGATMVVGDLSRSVDPAGCGIVLYEWDWNGDGVFDEATVFPVLMKDYPSGFRGPIRARITTFGGETAVTSFSLGAVEEPAMSITVNATPSLNRQTGLYEQLITITNDSATVIEGFKVLIGGLAPVITVYNATGSGEGGFFIDFPQTLAPGESLSVRIEYYSSDRITVPNPELAVEITDVVIPPVLEGERRQVRRAIRLQDETFLIEFDTTPGKEYVIEYTSDLNDWKQATPRITAFGNRLQWIDSGPPKTDSLPGGATQRFYRVVELP